MARAGTAFERCHCGSQPPRQSRLPTAPACVGSILLGDGSFPPARLPCYPLPSLPLPSEKWSRFSLTAQFLTTLAGCLFQVRVVHVGVNDVAVVFLRHPEGCHHFHERFCLLFWHGV